MFLRTVVARCAMASKPRPYVSANAIVICKPKSFRLKHGVGNIIHVKYTNEPPVASYHRANIIEHGELEFQTYDRQGELSIEREYKTWVLCHTPKALIEYSKVFDDCFTKQTKDHKYIRDLALVFNMCAFSTMNEFLKHDIFTEIPLDLTHIHIEILRTIGLRNIYPIYTDHQN
jgi:hypothetical protein